MPPILTLSQVWKQLCEQAGCASQSARGDNSILLEKPEVSPPIPSVAGLLSVVRFLVYCVAS